MEFCFNPIISIRHVHMHLKKKNIGLHYIELSSYKPGNFSRYICIWIEKSVGSHYILSYKFIRVRHYIKEKTNYKALPKSVHVSSRRNWWIHDDSRTVALTCFVLSRFTYLIVFFLCWNLLLSCRQTCSVP